MQVINISNVGPEEQIIMDTSTSGITYVGYSAPGIPTSQPLWKIKKLVETSTSFSVLMADGNDNYDNTWDSRASYTYS